MVSAREEVERLIEELEAQRKRLNAELRAARKKRDSLPADDRQLELFNGPL